MGLGHAEKVVRDVEGLKRVLLALPDLGLRVEWLREHLSGLALGDAASLLDQLCEQNERSEARAREAALAVAALFAKIGDCDLVARLREEAAGRHLLSLDRLLRRAPPGAGERHVVEVRVPDYGVGRELSLGERKSLARRPSRRIFEKLLADPHPMVIRQLLTNPKLTEDDVVRLAARRPARAEVLEELARAPRWLARSRVRMTLILNPGSPAAISMPLLGVCTRAELCEIFSSADTTALLRATAHELIERRPPLREWDAADAVLQ
jgi:hypothetical protein